MTGRFPAAGDRQSPLCPVFAPGAGGVAVPDSRSFAHPCSRVCPGYGVESFLTSPGVVGRSSKHTSTAGHRAIACSPHCSGSGSGAGRLKVVILSRDPVPVHAGSSPRSGCATHRLPGSHTGYPRYRVPVCTELCREPDTRRPGTAGVAHGMTGSVLPVRAACTEPCLNEPPTPIMAIFTTGKACQAGGAANATATGRKTRPGAGFSRSRELPGRSCRVASFARPSSGFPLSNSGFILNSACWSRSGGLQTGMLRPGRPRLGGSPIDMANLATILTVCREEGSGTFARPSIQ